MTLRINLSCVSVAGRGVLIEGRPGSGKSGLALALIDRGAQLVGDDGVTVAVEDGRLIAAPPPRGAGLIEVRNVGLIERPLSGPVPVALVLALDEAAPRYIDAAEKVEIEGVAIPLVRLWPNSPILALRAEIALERWGLP